MGKASQVVSAALTIKATAAVTAKRFIGYNGQHCAANAKAVGVSAFDAASGEPITVYGAGNIVPVTAGGAISAGAYVASDANGKAVAASPLSVSVPAGATQVTSTAAQPDLVEAGGYLPQAVNGLAMESATADGDTILVLVL